MVNREKKILLSRDLYRHLLQNMLNLTEKMAAFLHVGIQVKNYAIDIYSVVLK